LTHSKEAYPSFVLVKYAQVTSEEGIAEYPEICVVHGLKFDVASSLVPEYILFLRYLVSVYSTKSNVKRREIGLPLIDITIAIVKSHSNIVSTTEIICPCTH
jgi:hypothetical protein